jgi:probable addiction module antidote protein
METAVLEKLEKTIPFAEYDPAEYINLKEDVIAELKVTLEENDPVLLLSAMEDIVRSAGFSEIARELGLERESLRQTIAPNGVLALESVIKLLDLMGFRLKVEPKSA